MTQENDSYLDDLSQIVENQRSSFEMLEQLKTVKPDEERDIADIQERTKKNIEDVEQMAARAREEMADD